MTGPSPFTILGLPASTHLPASTDLPANSDLPAHIEVTDDDVRAAWRRVAAATHPDRADGGDAAAFADAAAAYTALRTQAGRTEALARVRERAADLSTGGPVPGRSHQPVHAVLASRIAEGRPWRLALRALAVAAACYLAVVAAGWQPASAAVMTGALTWLLRTGRADLGPRRPDSS